MVVVGTVERVGQGISNYSFLQEVPTTKGQLDWCNGLEVEFGVEKGIGSGGVRVNQITHTFKKCPHTKFQVDWCNGWEDESEGF